MLIFDEMVKIARKLWKTGVQSKNGLTVRTAEPTTYTSMS